MVYSIEEVIYLWEGYGIFNTLLPFLLIFAIIFGVLTAIGIFGKNKGINIIIALVIGLMAVRSEFMNQFYLELFPRLGIGVTIILFLLIFLGMFIAEDERRYWFWGIGAIALVIAIVVLVQTFGYLGWTYSLYGSDVIAWVAGGILIIGLIIAVAVSGSDKSGSQRAGDFGKSVYKKLFEH